MKRRIHLITRSSQLYFSIQGTLPYSQASLVYIPILFILIIHFQTEKDRLPSQAPTGVSSPTLLDYELTLFTSPADKKKVFDVPGSPT